jgi:hypothetical protein
MEPRGRPVIITILQADWPQVGLNCQINAREIGIPNVQYFRKLWSRIDFMPSTRKTTNLHWYL